MRRKNEKKNFWKRFLSLVSTVALIAASLPTHVSADETEVNQVEIYEVTSNGFTHPGVGLTKSELELVRAKVQAKAEPWYTYYQAMAQSSAASKTVTSSNQSSEDPTKPASDAFNSQGFNSRFISDGLKAYTQALMYIFSGDETYRANAMKIIRIWSQMDPAKYEYFTDAHIHTGIPMNRMVNAAEMMRYTSAQTEELIWTEQDTLNLTNNLINPAIDTFMHSPDYFMNQHNYPLIGSISGYIFTENTERYQEAVEWFTVNETAENQGFNGSIKRLFRLVEQNDVTGEPLVPPRVQHVEMGRDQAHGGGDITNATIISNLLMAQETKVDPMEGTVSTNPDAVGPYEFLNDRILDAANYFWQFMLGYDTPWTPVAYSIRDGEIVDTYNQISTGYWGRFNTANFWDLYTYYTYEKGVNLAEKAPYFYEAVTKMLPPIFYYGEGENNNWDNRDGGGDYWLHFPADAEANADALIGKPQNSPYLIDIEDRYTKLEGSSSTVEEDGTAFIRMLATETGSKIAVNNASTSQKVIGFKIRTNGEARLELTVGGDASILLPNTKGQWKYVTYAMSEFQSLTDMVFLKVTGSGATVDIDHLHVQAGTQLSPPVFASGLSDINLFTWIGAPVSVQVNASDSNALDTLTYESDNLPPGAALNATTGMVQWTPVESGTFTFTVSATDGTAITVKKVNVTVADDRASAVQAAISPYAPNAVYEQETLDAYQSEYANTMSVLNSASEADFGNKLKTLRSAVEGLRLITPLLEDGSIDYPALVSTSTMGSNISKMIDSDSNTGTSYLQAPGKYHIIDFGPDFKISATQFGLQSNIFADRLAGSAVFGSNDGETWTRLTPELTSFTQSYQTLDVAPGLQNEKFRMLKVELLEVHPDALRGDYINLFEMTEFHIFGTRYETNNKIESVSLGSPQSKSGKVSLGDTVFLTVKAKEPVQNMNVTIQGQQVAATSPDQLNWTAMTVLSEDAPTGPVGFELHYERADGTEGDPIYITTDDSALFAVDPTKAIAVSNLATVTASHAQWPGNGLSKEQVGYLLFDGDIATAGDLMSGADSYYIIDFGEGSSLEMEEAVLMPRNANHGRLNGMVIQGSNDQSVWTDLTEPLKDAQDGRWISIGYDELLAHEPYRFIRLYNSNAWFGNVAEVELYGVYDITDISSRMVPPDGYTRASYALYQQEANRIQAALNEPGANKAMLLSELSEAESLLISSSTIAAEKISVSSSMVTASTIPWVPAGTTNTETKEQNGWRAFDGNLNTGTDATSNPAWILVDFGESNAKSLGSFKYYPRSGNIKRLSGAILQGSNDGTTFTDLYTLPSYTTSSAYQWYSAAISDDTAYRYLRYYSQNGLANVAELEFYGKVIDKTLLTSLLAQANSIQTELYTESSLQVLSDAKTVAEAVAQGTGLAQSEVDEAASALSAALDQLAYRDDVPLLAPIADASIDAETQLTFAVSLMNEPTGAVISAEGLPDGASFDSATNTFAWTPSKEQGGVHSIVFKAEANNLTTEKTVRITVKGLPNIAANTVIELMATQPIEYQVVATDPSGESLVYSAGNTPGGSSLNSSSGVFRWVPSQADFGGNTVTFYASNGKYTVSQSVTFNVSLHVIAPTAYTKGSYYLYDKEFARINEAMQTSGADKKALAAQLANAEASLVPVSTLPAERIQVSSSMVAASTVPWPDASAGTAEENGWRAFDGDLSSATDTLANPSWILVDLGESQAETLGSFSFYPRSGDATQISRMNGAILQGSNDGTTFTDLYTINGISVADWYSVPITDETAYRYLRYYAASGNSNVAELEFYKKGVDSTLLSMKLEEAGMLKPEEYEEQGYAAVQQAVNETLPVLQDIEHTQAQIDAASEQLIAAMEQLVKKPVIVSLAAVQAVTVVGTAPALPTVVDAVYNDESALSVPVVWNTIDPIQYSMPGSFTVSGSVYGTTITAIANVTVIDEDAPLPPANLSVVDVTETSLTLKWTPSIDDVGVVRYEVYKDGAQAGTVTGSTYSYSFTGLSASTAYLLKVVAYDEAGNYTASADYEAVTAPSQPNGGGGSVVTTGPQSTAPEIVIEGHEIKLTPKVTQGVLQAIVSSESLFKAIANASQSMLSSIRIELSAEERMTSIAVELPAEAWLKAREEGIQSVFIESGLVSLEISTAAAPSLHAGDKLELVVVTVDPADLPASAAGLRDRPIFEFELKVNGENAGEFPAGSGVTVRIPYSVQDGERSPGLIVVYVDDNGKLEVLRHSKYDEEQGSVVFHAEHFSKYAIVSVPLAYTDMEAYPWAYDSVLALTAREILNGVGNERFAPGQTVTRAEFLKMTMEAFGLVQEGLPSTFTDVQTGQWYSDVVGTAQAMKIVSGYEDGSFGVNREITREEMAVMAVRIMKAAGADIGKVREGASFQDHDRIAAFAEEAVRMLNQAGYIEGRDHRTFAPQAETTRAEAAVLVSRLLGFN